MNKYFSKYITVPLLTFGILSPTAAHAQTQTALGEVSNFAELISLIWSYGSQVIIALAVFLIVVGAFFYVSSGGNDERINQGKQLIFGSLIAVMIVIFSGVLIRTLHKPAEGTTGALTDVPTVIANATNILVGVIGAFTVLMFIYSGLQFVLARGDTEKIGKAKVALRYAVYGLVIGVLAFTAVRALVNYFI